MVLAKKCTQCEEVKPLEMFNKWSLCKTTGRASACRACKSSNRKDNAQAIARQKRAWYDKNKEHVAEKGKASRKDDPEKYKEKEATKYLKFSDKIKARVLDYQKRVPDVNRRAAKKYRAANPHLCCIKAAKRRAAKLQATPKWAKEEFEQLFLFEIYHLAKLRKEVGLECHVDHRVPLVSKVVCGLHCAANLRILPARENESKGNKYWPDMW